MQKKYQSQRLVLFIVFFNYLLFFNERRLGTANVNNTTEPQTIPATKAFSFSKHSKKILATINTNAVTITIALKLAFFLLITGARYKQATPTT